MKKLPPLLLLVLALPVFADYNWTGPYLGLTAGVNRIETRNTIPGYRPSVTPDITSTNFAGGFKAGYNYQFNSKFLLGIEGNIIFTPGSKSDSLTGGDNSERYSVKQDHVINVIVKAGCAFDKLLPYIKAGYSNTRLSDLNYTYWTEGAKKSNHSGYILGAGLDYALKENIILGVDYSYTNYKDKSFVYGGPNTLEPETNSLLGSVSYKF
jgi:outer membrane immunogenic protein